MKVPGSNLMGIALRVISSQTVQWFQYTSRALNAAGIWQSTYATPVPVPRGSVQAVPRERYEELNLDWQKQYVYWYTPNTPASSLARFPENNGDIIEWGGRRYQLIGNTNWYVQDGWQGYLCVDVGPSTGALTNA